LADLSDTWKRLRDDAAPLGAAAVLAGCTLSASLLEGGLLASPRASLALLVVAVAAWAVGARRAAKSVRLLLVVLVGLRLVALVVPPSLSDDIHRYVHEGRASRLGLAVPYETRPQDITPPPDDGTSARVNHPEVPAAYPPTSQLFLLAAVAAGDAVTLPRGPLRLLLALCDALVVIVLWRRRRDRPRAWLLYGLHPLPLLEACVGSHLDALGAALVVVAVAFSRAPLARGALLGLAVGVKPTALLGLIAGPLRRRALVLAFSGVVLGVLAPTLPYLVVDAPLTRGLVEYGTRWEAQPTVYALASAAFTPTFEQREREGTWAHLHRSGRGLLVEEGGVPRLSLGAPVSVERPLLLDGRLFARGVALALLLAALSVCLRLRDPYARVAWAFTALWLIAPTMHPWYLLWSLPFAALANARGVLLWGAAVPLAYEAAMRAAADGVWEESWWPRLVALAALTTGTALDLHARRAAPPQPRQSSPPATTG
jgi:hypothetical protein